ncbi:MAG: DUF1476 domain-containing protein [Methylobacterium sp.]|uniref:ATPase inhibitor subunit zeta n=1 Tax=Methylobacterium sp. TaxID=409 RepID=UPI0025DE2F76|nr:ATPase inhibitor subunit zeta [Methylobacterium sp.]MBX9930327.1 DUF1476 domain-containing protein [Methylobacterium sp.]
MSKIFEERERAAEMLFVRAEEARFMMHCQGVRSLAAYAAWKLRIDEQGATAYARELLSAAMEGAKDEDLVERVRADLAAGGVIVDPASLRRELNRPTTQGVFAVGPAEPRQGAESRV